jgi:hypothetical protein
MKDRLASLASLLLVSLSAASATAPPAAAAAAAARNARQITVTPLDSIDLRLLQAALEEATSGYSSTVDLNITHAVGNTSSGNSCPDSLYYCSDPETVLPDPTIRCVQSTCEWDFAALDPQNKPHFCQSIVFVPPVNTSALPDILEPCFWWDFLFGDLQPSKVNAVVVNNLEPTRPPLVDNGECGGALQSDGIDAAANVVDTEFCCPLMRR